MAKKEAVCERSYCHSGISDQTLRDISESSVICRQINRKLV